MSSDIYAALNAKPALYGVQVINGDTRKATPRLAVPPR
jgi:hypothetical protein